MLEILLALVAVLVVLNSHMWVMHVKAMKAMKMTAPGNDYMRVDDVLKCIDKAFDKAGDKIGNK
tara:strand:+ start:1569 stop:1760 length:192 start_codon:yes stop_codon:yes gene_type:complete